MDKAKSFFFDKEKAPSISVERAVKDNILSNIILPEGEQFFNIPDELKQLNQWICYKNSINRYGKLKSKIPFNPHTGKEDYNKPDEWATFSKALEVVSKYEGLGFRFLDGSLYVGIDIDTCITPETGGVSPEALEIIKHFDSYTEYSPSGYGVHIWVKVQKFITLPFNKKPMKPNGITRPCIDIETGEFEKDKAGNIKYKRPEIEIYNKGRYFTMTGMIYGENKAIKESTWQLTQFLAMYEKTAKIEPQGLIPQRKNNPTTLSDNEILKKIFSLKEGAQYKSLYKGDISAYQSASNADLALCNLLCAFSRADYSTIDRLFRQSRLMRDKWDEKRGKLTYGQMTINKALASYNPTEYRQTSPSAEWNTPITLDDVELPPFPVDCFPDVLKNYVLAVAEDTQTPIDMAGVACLAVMALCVQGKYKVKVKGSWSEPLNLYSVIVANPAERKSPILRLLTKSIYDYELEYNQRIKPEIMNNKNFRECLENEITVLKKSKNASSKFSEIQSRQDKLDQLDEINEIRLIADDITPEQLTTIMSKNREKMAVISAEGGIFEIIKGRYTEGKTNMEVYLKAHSGDSLKVDRRGRTETLYNPCLTLLIAIQPQVLEGLISNVAFRGRGLTARFLYTIPKSIVGSRRSVTNDIPPEYTKSYKNLCYDLLNISFNGEVEYIHLSAEAEKRSIKFTEELEPLLRTTLEDVQDWAGKLHGCILRIAGILHIVENYACTVKKPISEETLNKAITLGYYFLEHTKNAFKLMGADEQLQGVKYVLKQLVKQSQTKLKKYDVFRLCRGKYKKADDVLPALELLIEYGYLKKQPAELSTEDKGGMPKGNLYLLNPLYF